MEQTNKSKLKFKIARGINALSNETIEFRKEAIIELFRVFDNTELIHEEKAAEMLEQNNSINTDLIGLFNWSSDIKGHDYWYSLYHKLGGNL